MFPLSFIADNCVLRAFPLAQHSREEHMERVRQRVEARNNPTRMGVWSKMQAGIFASRGEPKPPAAAAAAP